MRIIVTYNQALAIPGVFCVTQFGTAIKSRFKIASSREFVVESQVRYKSDKLSHEEKIFFSPISQETWLLENHDFWGQLPMKIVLQLNGCPEGVYSTFRRL